MPTNLGKRPVGPPSRQRTSSDGVCDDTRLAAHACMWVVCVLGLVGLVEA